MSSILYYSNFCEKCKTILKQLSSSKVKDDVHFVCIDKRARDERTGATYIILENNQKVVLPPNINKVPALLLLKEGNNILFGNEIMNKARIPSSIIGIGITFVAVMYDWAFWGFCLH